MTTQVENPAVETPNAHALEVGRLVARLMDRSEEDRRSILIGLSGDTEDDGNHTSKGSADVSTVAACAADLAIAPPEVRRDVLAVIVESMAGDKVVAGLKFDDDDAPAKVEPNTHRDGEATPVDRGELTRKIHALLGDLTDDALAGLLNGMTEVEDGLTDRREQRQKERRARRRLDLQRVRDRIDTQCDARSRSPQSLPIPESGRRRVWQLWMCEDESSGDGTGECILDRCFMATDGEAVAMAQAAYQSVVNIAQDVSEAVREGFDDHLPATSETAADDPMPLGCADRRPVKPAATEPMPGSNTEADDDAFPEIELPPERQAETDIETQRMFSIAVRPMRIDDEGPVGDDDPVIERFVQISKGDIRRIANYLANMPTAIGIVDCTESLTLATSHG